MNVLLITLDQWRGDSLSAVGHPLVKTPHIDTLAADGVLFTRHYCQAAPCGPARASLLTGLYQMNHRVCRNGSPLDARHDNIALMMRRLGYDPAMFGYTDTAADPRICEENDPRLMTYQGLLPGFNHVQPLPDHCEPWFSWLDHNGIDVPARKKDIYLPAEGSPDPPSGAPARYPAALSEAAFLTKRLLDYLREKGNRNWFSHVSFLRPHPPFIAPEPFNAMYDPAAVPDFVRAATVEEERAGHPFVDFTLTTQPKTGFVTGAYGLATDWDDDARRQIRATYYGLISEVDVQIGRIVQYLKDAGIYDNTIIVLTSDHGEMAGDHYQFGKLGYFDQAYHIPLIVRMPGAAGAGRQVSAFTESVDVVPSLLDVLGGAIPRAVDGYSLRSFLEGGEPDTWRDAAHWEFDFRELGSNLPEQRLGIDSDDCALSVIRDDRFKYVHFTSLPSLLFDLRADPGELNNVADDPAYAVQRVTYAEKLLTWRARNLDRTLTGVSLTEAGPVGLPA